MNVDMAEREASPSSDKAIQFINNIIRWLVLLYKNHKSLGIYLTHTWGVQCWQQLRVGRQAPYSPVRTAIRAAQSDARSAAGASRSAVSR